MKFVDFLGDDRLRYKIVYTRDSYTECVYCGEKADTREHVPSKVFLVKPYPAFLGIVPACFKCNNSFSSDELFLSILIEKLKSIYYGEKYILSEETIGRINKYKKIANQIDMAIANKRINEFDKRISRVLFKLAIGHAVFEVSEGYCIKEGIVSYSFRDSMSNEEIEEFSAPFILNGQVFPEVGSRAFERIIVVEMDLASVHDPEQKINTRLALLEWVDVQATKYSYTSYLFGDEIVVKIIINEFLYAQVIIRLDDN
ncbi:hypothetical protein [Brevibacillus borstelensis]|uniref:hypothetical protein n=1 Tax=Brevibacillus borstelensis TaxID=45462 RepID=UPI00057BF889|nr:hypothetical protein [Brevibacillus borstelensis]MED1876959.1 hypothetical protein [Brevibacillus borstelensis]